MRTIGHRQLKANLDAVLREIEERGEEFAVTRRGRVIARLAPASSRAAFEACWAEMDAVASEIGRDWPAGVSAAEALAEDRAAR